jgi:hypothetical protein
VHHHVLGAHIRIHRAPRAGAQHGARTDAREPGVGKGLVDIQHRDAIGAERVVDLALGRRHRLQAPETLQVRRQRIGQHGDIGPHQRAQIADVARLRAPISITA